MSGGRRFSPARQRAVILAAAAAHPEGISRLKLRSMLFLIDLEAYRNLGKSITGATYRRGKIAPIVQGLTRSIQRLRKDGSIR